MLGHEELQSASSHYLGERRLAHYRNRLHAWADSYRAKGWPLDTPEYLLSGYYPMITAVGELARLLDCALDAKRHDRMLDLTGGDSAALIETLTALESVAEQDPPDLAAALKLARHRNHLTDRNFDMPRKLPAVWAILGHVDRASALADSLPVPARRASALLELAEALATTGRIEHAVTLVAEAETVARGLEESRQTEDILTAVARALATAGCAEQAVSLAKSFANPYTSAVVITAVAESLAIAGYTDEAVAVARSHAEPSRRAYALATVAQALAVTGKTARVAPLASEAEAVARSMPLSLS